MSIVKWRNKRDPGGSRELMRASPIGQLRSELDRLFERFLGEPWSPLENFFAPLSASEWLPSLDVTETEKEVTIRAEVPGVDPKELDIRVTGQCLTLSGEKKESHEEKGENFHRTERHFGAFRRTVELPATVDTEKVAAEHANGVLTIRLQKTPGATPRKIAVKVTTK